MHILIVEDSKVMQEYLREAVEPFGRVSVVDDGRSAVNFFIRSLEDNSSLELILLDIQMPILDGHQALTMIRRLEEQRFGAIRTKVVMVSSLADYENIIKAQFEERADAYLTKPFKKEALLEILRNLGLINQGEFPEDQITP